MAEEDDVSELTVSRPRKSKRAKGAQSWQSHAENKPVTEVTEPDPESESGSHRGSAAKSNPSGKANPH